MRALEQFHTRRGAEVPRGAQAHLAQRRCACGGVVGADGECAACKAKRLGLAPEAGLSRPGALPEPGADRPRATEPRLQAPPGAGHAFGRIAVGASRPAGAARTSAARGADAAELPINGLPADPEVDLAEEAPGAGTVAPAADTAETKTSCCRWRSFEKSDDSYVDKPGDTRKNIKFTCGVDYTSDPKKCVMVNWIQGTAKNKDGTFRKVQMFDKIVDYNFPTMRIDSMDKDPIYWSDSSGRWNYQFTMGTGDVFFATDSPGPTTWVDGIDYDLKFKMCLYCIDDVSTTSSAAGSGVKNPLKCIDWVFKAKYDAATDTFTH